MDVSLDTVHNTYTMEDFLAGLPGFRCDLSDLGLSEQTYTRLIRAGITSIEKLIQSSEQELYFQYRISKRVREEITARLAEKGYRLYAERKGPKQQTIMLSTRKDNWKLQLCGEIMDYEELQPFTKVIPPDYLETFTYITQRILTQNEQVALSMRYYDQWSIDAISMKLDVSRQAVMSLLESALRKLKDDRVKVCLIHGMKLQTVTHALSLQSVAHTVNWFYFIFPANLLFHPLNVQFYGAGVIGIFTAPDPFINRKL